MIQSILMMGGLGVAIGTVLVIASKAFYVYEDPTVVAINDELPGANCGGCGFPGCSANAEAIAKGEQSVNSCVAAGEDVAMAIAAIMGVSVSDTEPEFAGPGCYYGTKDADQNYTYKGIKDCRAAAMLMGGMKTCRIGCLGLGTCVTACKFGALSIGESGLPEVDQTKCTGCGACEKICPKNIIRLTSVTRRIMREYTTEECITPCQRACPSGLDIKEYIRLIKEGDYAGSLQVIKERMPFPTVISRICPALCEFDCRRGLQDEAVGINDLKRFVVDWEMAQDERIQPYKAPATDKKIAVVGGGVEGLSAAYFSA
ncbi:MAG: RnfABCDGE type electron transport complex subunit B, partial [Desulfovibrionales bacterium]|nr:RnfABCDGE type electron transport complex subunit B [Desulfovibrionales bacterium]